MLTSSRLLTPLERRKRTTSNRSLPNILLLLLLLPLNACSTLRNSEKDHVPERSIVILYENDVHCKINGYKRLAGLRDHIAQADTAYVGIVSCGDFLNGDVAGALTRGQYIVDVMRQVRYDAVTLGNHEFDFGVHRMQELLPQIGAPVLCANLFVNGLDTPMYAPYLLCHYGNKQVAFVGVCTPSAMADESYSFFDEEGHQLYDLRPMQVFKLVQQAVDAARSEGADYVVLLSHLGEAPTADDVDSHTIVSHTHGIDVVLDGHTHSVIPHKEVPNDEGQPISISQTGTQFANIGKLVIAPNGRCSVELIPVADLKNENSRVAATVDSLTTLMNATTSRVLGRCDFKLTINDQQGHRLVRRGETNLGDLCADAMRERLHTDIGFTNGGGIRNNIPEGNLTYGHAIGVQPFYNLSCVLEVPGSWIPLLLEQRTCHYPAEDGGFPQVAGMRYTLHSVSHRVDGIEILNRATGVYEPLQPDKYYTIGTSNYFYQSNKVPDDCRILKQTQQQICDTFADYITDNLKGVVGEEYRHPQGRLTIVDD
ncbi:MAG: bifunctional metallophosphatase/5'-nucleotidase [Bacteroidales bacterium]|nr:bifunctional metallophosphatase/5'-nucleotidase [Bacteroidales bacterium]